jgi:NADPH2:quinone reductase
MAPTFQAFRVYEEQGKVEGRVAAVSLDELSPGEVVVDAEYSSVNYKDALAATGAGKIIRRFPLTGGIDVSGVVESSEDPRFRPGDRVLATGFGLGVTHDGGFGAKVRMPGDWIVALPDGLTPFEAMAIGTAGFTAAMSVLAMEHNGLVPTAGPVIVTGATGGVGSIAVDMLAARGYSVTAVTGKDAEHDYLRTIGARDVLSRSGIEMRNVPLDKAKWAGAVDPVGGETLAWLTRTMLPEGTIAASGLTGGSELHTTVMPFILRGVKLLGIDSAACPMTRRLEVWRRAASDMKPRHLDAIAREISLADLPRVFPELLRGGVRGRYVVRHAR